MMDMRKGIALVAVLAVVACGNQDEGRRVPIGGDQQEATGRESWPEELAIQVDSANLEYSQDKYQAAADRYRVLTEQYPDIGTVWFGLYMAENALGNDEEAQAALARAEEMAPGLGQMHDAAEQGDMGPAHPPIEQMMPAGHPPLDSVNPEDAPPLGEPGESGG